MGKKEQPGGGEQDGNVGVSEASAIGSVHENLASFDAEARFPQSSEGVNGAVGC
jgi:hypothetical protein